MEETKDNLSVKNIADRVKSPTPKFFKKIIWGGITLGAACAAVLTGGLALPALAITLLQAGVTVGVTAAAVGKLTKVTK